MTPHELKPWIDDAEFLRQVLSGAPGVIIVLDRRGRFRFINRVDPHRRPEDFVGISVFKLVHRSSLAVFKSAFRAALSGKVKTVRAAAADDPDDWWENTMGPLRKDGRVVAVISVAHRISEKVQLERTEADLERLRQRFEKMFYHSSDGMTITAGDGTLLDVNPAFCRLVGYSKGDLIRKKKFLEITAPEYREANRTIITTMVKTGEPVQFEKAYLRKDGTRVPVAITAFALKDIKGGAESYSAIVRDLTERKHVQLLIDESAAREQSRLGRDLHDGIGQYLTGISLLARSLQGKLSGHGLSKEAQEAARISVAANAAVAQTRALAQGLIPTELSGGLKGALAALAAGSKTLFGAEVSVTCPEKLPAADAKVAVNLYRIAQEAVHNACRHGRARRITIAVSARSRGALMMSIADDGAGLPARLKPGIGLRAMTHRAELIGGTLQVLRRKRGVVVLCRCHPRPS